MADLSIRAAARSAPAHGVSFAEALRVWLRVAALSFGGPAGQIAVMQSSTQAAVEAIHGIAQIVDDMDRIAASIAAAIEEQRAATQEIARSVQQAANGTRQVSGSVGGVAGAARSSGGAATEMLGAAGELNRQAVALRGAMDGFLAKVRTA